MGLFRFITRLFGFGNGDNSRGAEQMATAPAEGQYTNVTERLPAGVREGKRLQYPLRRLRYQSSLVATPNNVEVVESDELPYLWSTFGPFRGTYLDLTRDGDTGWLQEFHLPDLQTPAQLADWLEVELGELAWLSGRFRKEWEHKLGKSHYHYTWVTKRSGGVRLIESPKQKLKAIQHKILRGILDKIPAHRSAHGFVRNRSAVSNADPHVGAGVLFKLDLENFYGSITYARVVAIFRTVGFSREVAMWLASLTTNAAPFDLESPSHLHSAVSPYKKLHLPQGAPTSPALANLSAYSLDVRLSGLARSYKAVYTRYADDLTFSGPRGFITALRQFIPLAESVVSAERLTVNKSKRRVLRRNQRMTVTGIVVNEHLNVSRRDYDRLKATLHNCVKHGPKNQNHDDHSDFEAHLRGRVEYVRQLNPKRGDKLLALYNQIQWS